MQGVEPLEVVSAWSLGIVAQRIEKYFAKQHRLAEPPCDERLVLPRFLVFLFILLESKHQPRPTLERTPEKPQQVTK